MRPGPSKGLHTQHPASHSKVTARPAVRWPAPASDSGAVSSRRTRGSHPRGRGADQPFGRGLAIDLQDRITAPNTSAATFASVLVRPG